MTDPSASSAPQYVVGVDFGTLSGRAVVVRVEDGQQMATSVHDYRHGVIEQRLPATGVDLPSGWALQDPQDYLDVLASAVPSAVRASGVDPASVVGIAVDFTSCTVLPTTADGVPLCQLDDLVGRPHAYVKLWKHHAAQDQADRINSLAAQRQEPWLARYGGRVSAEWQFAKALQLLDEDPEVYQRTDRWIEATDWITWQLCGVETRNVSTAGYKGLRQDGRYPGAGFLAELDPAFAGFLGKIDHAVSPLGARAGDLTERAAGWTGLPAGIGVAVGNIDAHVTVPAAQALAPGHLLAVMGTSTCHVMNSPALVQVDGMCGVVDGGIVPGCYGYEAGQSGVGDIFSWFVREGVPQRYFDLAADRQVTIHTVLSELASVEGVGESGLLALDWHSGNRSILVDHDLSGVVVGQTLATTAPQIYRALCEATAFGTRTIIEAFETSGAAVERVVVAGGLVQNPFLMQIYADVTRRRLSIVGSDQAPALGAAMHAAVAAGAHADIWAASAAMGRVDHDVYQPNPTNAAAYDALFAEYRRLHDYFGRGGNDVMHRLRALSAAATAQRKGTS